MNIQIGIIGGSGLYDIQGLKVIDTIKVNTPYGDPSDEITIGEIENKLVGFLPRHGRGHKISPSEINYRANIYALKKLGANIIISVSAVGSMKKNIHPGDIVVISQFIDFTKKRVSSFFGDGIVGHVSIADPICNNLADQLYKAGKKLALPVKKGGTYICIEGPQFSTRAESNMYRLWDVDVIGMTNMPEAKLAREAGICYSTLALVTDYDCWHETEEDVSVDFVLKILKKNSINAKKILQNILPELSDIPNCRCKNAVKGAIITKEEYFPEQKKQELEIILKNN